MTPTFIRDISGNLVNLAWVESIQVQQGQLYPEGPEVPEERRERWYVRAFQPFMTGKFEEGFPIVEIWTLFEGTQGECTRWVAKLAGNLGIADWGLPMPSERS